MGFERAFLHPATTIFKWRKKGENRAESGGHCLSAEPDSKLAFLQSWLMGISQGNHGHKELSIFMFCHDRLASRALPTTSGDTINFELIFSHYLNHCPY